MHLSNPTALSIPPKPLTYSEYSPKSKNYSFTYFFFSLLINFNSLASSTLKIYSVNSPTSKMSLISPSPLPKWFFHHLKNNITKPKSILTKHFKNTFLSFSKIHFRTIITRRAFRGPKQKKIMFFFSLPSSLSGFVVAIRNCFLVCLWVSLVFHLSTLVFWFTVRISLPQPANRSFHVCFEYCLYIRARRVCWFFFV